MPHSPLRVLCLLPDMSGGGAQRTMVNLVKAFPQVGVEPVLVAARAHGPARTWLADAAPLVDLEVSRTRYAVGPLRRQIQSMQPDLLVSTMVDANIVMSIAASLLRRPPPTILRETNSHRARGDLGPLRRRLVRWAYRQAAVVISLSRGVADELVMDYGLERSRVETISNPVDVSSIKSRLECARAQEMAVNGKPLVVGIGRLTRQKGFDLLLDAFAGLDMPNAQLVLLGEGEDRSALERQAAEFGISGRVLFPGFVENPLNWLARADLFVLSSRWEGFGHVIVEAMAAGVPVVATNCPHGPRDILEDGVTGRLIPLGHGMVERLTSAMRATLHDSAQTVKMIDAASRRAADFETVTIAARYAGLFRRTLAERRSSL